MVKNFEKVDPAKVTATAHFVNDLGLDSLDAVEVSCSLFLMDCEILPNKVEIFCSDFT